MSTSRKVVMYIKHDDDRDSAVFSFSLRRIGTVSKETKDLLARLAKEVLIWAGHEKRAGQIDSLFDMPNGSFELMFNGRDYQMFGLSMSAPPGTFIEKAESGDGASLSSRINS